MQSLSKVQWYGLSFLTLHTIIIVMVYAAVRTTHDWQIGLFQQFFDYPLLSFINDISRQIFKKFPALYQYDDEIQYSVAAILGGVAYYSLGAAIGFVMTLVEPKTQESLDSQDHLS
ncbi:MAG: hypothetical protein ACAI34_12810 [Verrucomicrobium sp.]|nr:hypothetical protein [Verrucomicrobium sp.]